MLERMLHSVLFNKFKSFFLLLFAAFQRAMCCFRRRRRYSGDVAPLTHVVTAQMNSTKIGGDTDGWNDWNFTNRKPQTVTDHIEIYRQHKQNLLQRQQSGEVMSEDNFFEDMTPKITTQKKVLLQNNDERNIGVMGLNSHDFHADSAMAISKDLTEWDESEGWEAESLDAESMQLLREKKKQERDRRLLEQQHKRIDKMINRQSLGAKIS